MNGGPYRSSAERARRNVDLLQLVCLSTFDLLAFLGVLAMPLVTLVVAWLYFVTPEVAAELGAGAGGSTGGVILAHGFVALAGAGWLFTRYAA